MMLYLSKRGSAGTPPLKTRIYSFVSLSTWERMRDFTQADGRGDDWLRWGALKGFVDGSLGSTTAWFYDPYDDEPGTSASLLSDFLVRHRSAA